jgi:hypothetical protein
MDHHYYRFLADGSCDIICTRCFLKIGKGQTPDAAREQADSHICQVASCPGDFVNAPATEETGDAVREMLPNFGILRLPTPYLLLLAFVLFYAIPTVLEMAILRHPSLWAVDILIGDLSGCIGIFVVLKKKKLAVLLYLALTAIEFWLYSTQVISAHLLVYLMDLVPSVIMAVAILRPNARPAGLRA